MKCFNHREIEAYGICKSCQKAICNECTIDTMRGLACSSECEKEVNALNEIVDKSKQIYGIGNKSKMLPTGILMYFFFGLAFSGFGIYKSLLRGSPEIFLFIMGFGFLAIGVLAWWRNRKLNLNC